MTPAYNGMGDLVGNEWIIEKNTYGYTGVDASPTEQVDGVVVCDRHKHTTGNGHINPTGKGHTTGGTTGGTTPTINNKQAVVHKDYVIDYTSPLRNIILESEGGAGGLTYRYVYGLKKVETVIYGIPNGAGSVMQNGFVKLYYHQDHLGTTDYLTDNIDGKNASYVSYDDFSSLTAKAVLKMGVRELDLVQDYTGHSYDMVLGIYYAKARMYDADDRRFMAVDPVKGVTNNPQTFAQYTYCLNSPILLIDMKGKIPASITYNGKPFDTALFVDQDGRLYVALSDYINNYDQISADYSQQKQYIGVTVGSGKNARTLQFAGYLSMSMKTLARANVVSGDPPDVMAIGVHINPAERLTFMVVLDAKGNRKILVDFDYFNEIICFSLNNDKDKDFKPIV